MERNERMADLVIQAMDGDSSAFEELYRSSYKSVFFHAQKVLNNEQDVEDAVSEAFVRAFENLSKLQEPALFQPWIDRIATNISLNMVRDGRYREASSLDDENFCYEPIAADADTPSMVLYRKGTEEIVGRMIDALPEVQRTTVILYYYDEMSVAAIAKTMGCSEGTVKSRLNYARKNLEQAVLAEEKRGVKLYSVTPALVFAAIRRMIAVMPISRASIIHTARRIAEEVQPSGFSSVSPDAESKAAKSSSAPEEIIRSTLPSKRRAYKTTGKKAPAGKASGKAASGAATKATAAAAAAAKTGVTAKIVAAVLAGTLLFGGGVLTASAAARENLSQFLENVPVIGDLLSRNSEERPSEQTSEPAVSEAIKEQSPLSPISAAPEEISNPPEEKEPIIVNEGSLEGTPLDPTVTYLAAYEPVFDIYRSFFSGNYPTSGGLGSDDILFYSFFTSYGNMGVGTYPHEYNISVSEIGYMLRDVNGDGIPELITGYMGPKDPDRPLEDTVIYDMHTLENGQPKLILASSPRHRYRLCQDNLILNDGSAGATNLYRRLFRYSSTDKELIYSLTMNQPYYYEGTAENSTQQPAETDTILTEEEFKAKEDAIYANVVHLELKPLPFVEEQNNLYRQFLLRGDLMKSYDLNVSQLRYRFFDIDKDGINELYFAMPTDADSEWLVIGKLRLNNDNQVIQTLSFLSKEYAEASGFTALYGTVKMNGKRMEAEYIGFSDYQEWIICDPNGYKNPDVPLYVNGFEYYRSDDGYSVWNDNEYQITKEEFPFFYQQVDIIIGTGFMSDSYTQTISYGELMGNEVPDPAISEYKVSVDWDQNTQLPSELTLNLSYEGALHTLSFADDAVIHIFGRGTSALGDLLYTFYADVNQSLEEFIDAYNQGRYGLGIPGTTGQNAYVQIKNGAIQALWLDYPAGG